MHDGMDKDGSAGRNATRGVKMGAIGEPIHNSFVPSTFRKTATDLQASLPADCKWQIVDPVQVRFVDYQLKQGGNIRVHLIAARCACNRVVFVNWRNMRYGKSNMCMPCGNRERAASIPGRQGPWFCSSLSAPQWSEAARFVADVGPRPTTDHFLAIEGRSPGVKLDGRAGVSVQLSHEKYTSAASVGRMVGISREAIWKRLKKGQDPGAPRGGVRAPVAK